MEKHTSGKTGREVSRRDFIKTSAGVSLAAVLPGAGSVFAAGSDRLKIGLVGCGGQSYSNRGWPGDWGEKALRFLNERKAGQISEMEYQCRNGYHFDWTSGEPSLLHM